MNANEPKHTPGPWYVAKLPPDVDKPGMLGMEGEQTGEDYEGCAIVAYTGDHVVYSKSSSLHGYANSFANATLIHASRDLLETCEALVNSIEKWESSVESVIGRVPRTFIELDKARAAIAKARGEK